jgi:hypothetical protein
LLTQTLLKAAQPALEIEQAIPQRSRGALGARFDGCGKR